jgi:ATP-dependent Clp protease ATP-binding subunit ClpA
MTSNAGARDIGKKQIGFGDQINDDRVMEQAVVQLFSPEFRNRLDAIVQFHHLTRDSIELVVRKEIKFLKSKLNKKKITLSITEDCIMQLVKESYSKEFGARQVARTIEKNLISLLVDEILFGRLVYGGYVKMDWRGDDGYCMDMFEEIIPEKHLDFSQNIGE